MSLSELRNPAVVLHNVIAQSDSWRIPVCLHGRKKVQMVPSKHFPETSRTAESTDPAMNVVKMKNMILFFIEQCPGSALGKTKLMKLLYFADFDHYDDHRSSISNASYSKFEHGPVPRAVFPLLEEMNESGEIQMGPDPMYPMRVSFTANREFQPSEFSTEEKQTLLRVADRWRSSSKEAIEHASHVDAPWAASGDRDTIPYELVLYRNTHGDMDFDDDEIWEGDE